MIIKTKKNVSFSEHVEQIGKFTIPNKTEVIFDSMPVNSDIDGIAEIHIDILKPLKYGFHSYITYYQNYFTEIEVLEDDVLVKKTNPQKKKLITYKKHIDYNTMQSMFDSVDSLIDSSFKDMDRIDEKIYLLSINELINEKTYGDLTEDDFECVK